MPLLGPFKKRWNEKDYLFVLSFSLLFLFLSSYLLFNRKPLNIINNVLLTAYLILGTWRILKKKLLRFNWTVAILSIFGFWGSFASFVVGVFTYLPLLHSVLFLCIYLNLIDLTNSEKVSIFRCITYCFDLFSLAFFFYYLPHFVQGDFFRFGAFFGNQDYVAATLGLCVLFNLFLLSRKYYSGLFFTVLSTGLEMLTQTRMAFLIIVICFLVFVIFSFRKNKFALLGVISVLFISFLFLTKLDSFRGMFDRLLSMLAALITGNSSLDDSIGPRLTVIYRTYDLCFSMPFFSFGYDGIVKYGTTTTHDSFGQLAFCGGWIYSFIIHFYFFREIFLGNKKKSQFRLLSMLFFVDFLINFFLGTPFYNRYFFVYMPVFFSIVDIHEDDTNARRTFYFCERV